MLVANATIEMLECIRIALLLPSGYCKADRIVRLVRTMGIPGSMIIRTSADAIEAISMIPDGNKYDLFVKICDTEKELEEKLSQNYPHPVIRALDAELDELWEKYSNLP